MPRHSFSPQAPRVASLLLATLLVLAGMQRAHAQTQASCRADYAALVPIDQKLQSIQNASVAQSQMANQLQLFKAATLQRAQLIAKGRTDCALACKQDRAAVSSGNNRIQSLANKEQQESAGGINPFPVQQEIKQLQSQVQGEIALEVKDCPPFSDGLVPGSGIIQPNYQVLFVLYAPPGANGGKGVSYVDYGAGSSFETSVSTSDSLSNDLKISLSFSGGAFGDDASLGLNFDQSVDHTNTSSADLKETVSGDLKVPGPSADGIDHNSDQIYLLLNPTVRVSQSKASTTWSMGVAGGIADVQFVYVSWLKQPDTMPAGVVKQLQAAGIQPRDYPAILAVDPFANGTAPIDAGRFKQLTTLYPYEPTNDPNKLPQSYTYTIKDDQQIGNGTQTDSSTSLGVTVGAKVNAVFASLSLSVSDTFTYKYSKSSKDTTDTSDSESFTIGQPAYGYSGPTVLYIYEDTLFKTFLFSLTPPQGEVLLVSGVLTASDGKPQSHAEIVVRIGRSNYRTFTDDNGSYQIWGQPAFAARPAELQVGTQKVQLVLGSETVHQDVRLNESAPTGASPTL